jgi:NodT family efflux transporter outer membrane factor (OMF) lipoprotein
MKRLALLWALAALSGCSLAPAYMPPTLPPLPVAYKQLGPWQLAHPADSLPRGPWWNAYGDSTLDRLESQVDDNNPTLALAVAHYDIARADVAQAGSALWPQLSLGGSMTTNRQSQRRPLRSPNQPDFYPTNTLNFSIDYDLDVWGRVRNTVAAQKAAAQASASDVATIRLSLHAALASDYLALRGLDAQAALLAKTERAYRRAFGITQARYSGRIASGVDVARAQDQLQAAQAQEADVAAQRAQFENAIASLVGQPASAFQLSAEVNQIAVPQIPTGVPSTLLQRRPDIASAERQVAAANALVGVARAAFYPDISLGALLGFQDTGQAALLSAPFSFWTIGPQFAAPLFEGGLRRAQLAAAKASVRAAGASYRAAVLNAFQQVEDSLANLRLLQEALQRQSAAVQAANHAETMATSLYRDGATNFLDVVVAQTASLQAQQAALTLQTRELQSSVALIRALGGGWSVNQLPIIAAR